MSELSQKEVEGGISLGAMKIIRDRDRKNGSGTAGATAVRDDKLRKFSVLDTPIRQLDIIDFHQNEVFILRDTSHTIANGGVSSTCIWLTHGELLELQTEIEKIVRRKR